MSRLVVTLLLGGFALGCVPRSPAALPPSPDLPTQFLGAGSTDAALPASWREWVTDPALRDWIASALSQGFAPRLAEQTVARAQAGLRGARGARAPTVSGVASGSLTRFPAYTMDGAGYYSTPIDGRLPPVYPELNLGLAASWEVATWGRLKSLKAAALADYLASVQGQALVTAGVVAEVASTWSELAALDRTLEIIGASVVRQERALELVRAQKEAGRADELAVQQLAAELAETRSEEVDTQQRRFEAEGRLHALAGRTPSGLLPAAVAWVPLKAPAAGLPAEVLARRPDVLEAEQRLAAAGLKVRAARAAFFPSVTLSAGVGPSSLGLRYLVAPESLAAGLAGGLSAPLFNRAAIVADFGIAQADQAEALITYQQVILEAAVEVQTHLAGVARAEQRIARSEEQRAAAARAAEASEVLFAVGQATYVDVLLAQQAVLEAERDLVEAALARELSVIALYRAVGGGTEAPASAADDDALDRRRPRPGRAPRDDQGAGAG